MFGRAIWHPDAGMHRPLPLPTIRRKEWTSERGAMGRGDEIYAVMNGWLLFYASFWHCIYFTFLGLTTSYVRDRWYLHSCKHTTQYLHTYVLVHITHCTFMNVRVFVLCNVCVDRMSLCSHGDPYPVACGCGIAFSWMGPESTATLGSISILEL